MTTYQYEGGETVAQMLAETEQKLAEARRTIHELKHPKMPTPDSVGQARLLAATREAFGRRPQRAYQH